MRDSHLLRYADATNSWCRHSARCSRCARATRNAPSATLERVRLLLRASLWHRDATKRNRPGSSAAGTAGEVV